MKMGSLDLERLKDAFTSLVGSAETTALPAFLMWVDIKVAEYKCNGYMYSEPLRQHEGPWLGYSVDSLKYPLNSSDRGSTYGVSPDTTVQTEALELTKTPEKKSKLSSPTRATSQLDTPIYNIVPDAYKLSSSQHNAICLKESMGSSRHSPVYGTEACGIINLSVKSSSTPAEPTSPLKLTLKVPSVYHASSPRKANSPPLSQQATEPSRTIKMEGEPLCEQYSSLRSLLQSSQLATTVSPIKSDAESCSSSNGALPDSKERGSGGKNTECPYCGKCFQYRSSFRRHLKIHQGVYTHICAACSRKFTRKEHFVRHKCNRKPNIPNRSASRVELDPNAMPANGKIPLPKVAYPPALEGQHVLPRAVLEEAASPASTTDDNADVPRESRRKKSMPRKVVATEDGQPDSFMDDDDMLQAYDSPVLPPPALLPPLPPAAEDMLVSPADLSVELAESKEMHSGGATLEGETISTATGTYQVEQLADTTDKCIKVTKQSNYLKLRKEAQLINGQLCFVCPHCTKVFHRSSNFSRHMRIHRGVYSYICPACLRGFYRKEHFQKHKCTRKSMSRVWSRKTKIEMAASDGEKENVSEEDEIIEEVGADGEEGSEEGSLVIDESINDESVAVMPTPEAVDAGANEH